MRGAPSRSGGRPASNRTGRRGGIGRTSWCWAGRRREQSSKGRPMRAALYVRVSTDRQQQAQTIEQQVTQLHSYVATRDGWTVAAEHIFRDDGYSGAKLNRPGLDALRDQAAQAAFDLVLVAAPDRLARNFVHQMVVLEELERRGVRVVFCDRPLSDDPHEQLVTQIRGAVAACERTLIADRMRRGRQARLRSGQLLPRTRAPYGYRVGRGNPD
jgi:site-specific DNA recombinase